MHPLLTRQITSPFGTHEHAPDEVIAFARLLDEACRLAYADREGISASMEGAAGELLDRYEGLRASEESYRTLFERNPAPMLVCSEDECVILRANDAAVELMGMSAESLVGRSLEEFAQGAEQLLRSTTLSSEIQRLGEYRWKPEGKPELVLDLVAHHVIFRGRKSFLLLARDVSDWHRIREAMEESEERYRLLVERSPEGIAVHRGGKLLYLNPAGARMLGSIPASELVGQNLWDRIHPDSHSLLAELTSNAPAAESRTVECRLIREDGEAIDVELLSVPVRYNGRPAVQSVARDVTARRREERARHENEALLRVAEQRARTTADRMKTVADAAAKVIAADSEEALYPLLREACTVILPLDGFHFGLYDADQDLLRFPPDPWERTPGMTMPVKGSPNESVIRSRHVLVEDHGDALWDLAPDNTRRMCSSIRTPIVAGESVLGVLVVESCVPNLYGPDDTEVLQALAALAATALRNVRLVDEIRKSEERLAYQAFHDPLTDLANRVRFQERVMQSLARAEGKPESIAVLFLDLDDFKTVNDSLGHQQGDRLLVAASGRLLNATRGSDTVARLGGDEFAVLLENVRSEADMLTVAARISHALRSPFALEGKEVFVAASIGIARATPGITADELLRNADAAMYAAKTRGKSQHAIFEPAMHAEIVARLELEADLRRALTHGELRVHYQPIVDLATGRLTGMETLLRWAHPKRGWVMPRDFVPFAEETGLIVPIGRWVLQEACRQAATWQAEYPGAASLSITVNLSGRQLREASIAHDVRNALAESGLAGSRLVLEITESVLMNDTEGMLLKLQALKALGVSLAIDDFGTGYSSLGYLQRFPIDILKIDKSFIDAIGDEHRSPALARAIIALGDSLEMRTVAEGIERDVQVAELREMGCQLGQGYHFARPMPPEELEEMLVACAGDTSAHFPRLLPD